MLRVGQLRFAWPPPEWVVATSLCQSAGRYQLPHGILNAAVWFRRARLLIVSPDSAGTGCPLSGRNSTYRPVQNSGARSQKTYVYEPWIKGKFSEVVTVKNPGKWIFLAGIGPESEGDGKILFPGDF